MELTIGPVLFDWKKEELLRFYDEVADMPVDRVYLGEVVCVKKKGLSVKDLEEVGKKLEKAGKEVIVSTLAVVSNEDELKLVRDIANLPFAVEANDMSVFGILNPQSAIRNPQSIIAGPHITTYNAPSIEFLQGLGVKRIVFPVELSRDSIRHCVQNTGIYSEVFAHGNVPLAFSWRCYTSRAYR
ncbi:MAG: U32 family peptidase, partial [Deltaproteobacteria bacterium]